MKICIGKGNYGDFPQHYYWIKKAFRDLGHEVYEEWIPNPSFSFAADACQNLHPYRKKEIPHAYWTCHSPELAHNAETMAKESDVMFVGTKEYVETFKKWNPRTYHLLPAFDPKVYYPISMEEKYDIGFCGGVLQDRRRLLDMLEKEGFTVLKHEGGSMRNYLSHMISFKEVRELYHQSRLAFNFSHHHGCPLNMRIFETLGMGRCLLTSKYLSEPDTTFQDKKHLVIYHSDSELVDLARYYLDHEEERKEIGRIGREEVLKKHTWEIRARFILEVMRKEFGIDG